MQMSIQRPLAWQAVTPLCLLGALSDSCVGAGVDGFVTTERGRPRTHCYFQQHSRQRLVVSHGSTAAGRNSHYHRQSFCTEKIGQKVLFYKSSLLWYQTAGVTGSRVTSNAFSFCTSTSISTWTWLVPCLTTPNYREPGPPLAAPIWMCMTTANQEIPCCRHRPPLRRAWLLWMRN